MNRQFLQERVTAIQEQIVAYEAAILALAAGSVQSYTLDTTQSRQTVTKLNLTELRNTLQSLQNQCTVYEARLNGSGVTIAGVAF